MSEKRRDNKGRILYKGERQRKDGKYEFRTNDAYGNPVSKYSWRLVETDKIPPDKSPTPALRTLEQELLKDIQNGINVAEGSKATFDECFYKMLSQRSIKEQTKNQYTMLYHKNIKPKLGDMLLSDITRSLIYSYFSKLQEINGFSKSNLNSILNLIRLTLEYGVQNDIIHKNPCPGLNELPKYSNTKKKAKIDALTVNEQARLLEFVKKDNISNKHYNLLVFLLGTGCRISEATSLTWNDCDLDNNIIYINHSMTHKQTSKVKFKLSVSSTKSENSDRTIPILPEVKEALLNEKERTKFINSSSIGDYTDFVFKTRYGNPHRRTAINAALNSIIERYNKIDEQNAIKEGRDPCKLPHLSPHILRHTFATRIYHLTRDVKMLQVLLGHASASISLDNYTNITNDDKITEITKISRQLIYPDCINQ